jgi:hypothetical protein
MSNGWKEFYASAAELAVSVAVLFAMTPDADMQAWRFVSRVCQGVAHKFGTWGLASERRYLTLAEKGRMI